MRIRRPKKLKPGEGKIATGLYAPMQEELSKPESLEELHFMHNGEPVPASRPRLGRFGIYNPPEYQRYKTTLAHELGLKYRNYVQNVPPVGSRERTKFIKSNRYSLNLNVYRSSERGDFDNFLKTVQDAIQESGLIANDGQIDQVSGGKFIDKANPRIEFHLIRLRG